MDDMNKFGIIMILMSLTTGTVAAAPGECKLNEHTVLTSVLGCLNDAFSSFEKSSSVAASSKVGTAFTVD